MRRAGFAQRRVPDWQKDAIDSKWRWIVPWSLCPAGLLVSLIVVTSIWNEVMLQDLSRYVVRTVQLPLKLAAAAPNGEPELVVRLDEDLALHVGDVVIPTTMTEQEAAHQPMVKPAAAPVPDYPDPPSWRSDPPLRPLAEWSRELTECVVRRMPVDGTEPVIVMQVSADTTLDWILHVTLLLQPFSADVPRLRVEKDVRGARVDRLGGPIESGGAKTALRGLQTRSGGKNGGFGGAAPPNGGAPLKMGGAPRGPGGTHPKNRGAPPGLGGTPPEDGGAPRDLGAAPPELGGAARRRSWTPPFHGAAPRQPSKDAGGGF